ncbi:hypothetical protein [Chamaesiphon sp. VAR_48_metabat_403]|uniref:hypothetical protein n=1 Tax=Chamaesiphon sp. VAR_48_metabat_403 TaxID=2964700 RepID=UPI00286EA8EB|nr:hypothetical protein [Chamaesiphon sp. VAR_48_metabat_403]
MKRPVGRHLVAPVHLNTARPATTLPVGRHAASAEAANKVKFTEHSRPMAIVEILAM